MAAFATVELHSQKASDLLEEVRAQTKALLQRFRRLLITQLSTWTADLKNLCEKPLSCFKVFDPSTLPHTREELANYGDEEVDYLVTHFASLLNEEEKEKIPQEWMDLKMWLAQHRGNKLDCLYRDLLSENPEHLSHILLLVKLVLTLSPSTAICERGFSCMNRVKTAYRTSLQPDTLNDCMQLSINGDSVESFCPDKAVSFWMFSGKGSRHMEHKTPTRTKSREVETDAQEKDDEEDAMPSMSSAICDFS